MRLYFVLYMFFTFFFVFFGADGLPCVIASGHHALTCSRRCLKRSERRLTKTASACCRRPLWVQRCKGNAGCSNAVRQLDPFKRCPFFGKSAHGSSCAFFSYYASRLTCSALLYSALACPGLPFLSTASRSWGVFPLCWL